MKKTWLISLAILVAGYSISGCNSGTVTEADQDAKVKAMDDIAKKDTTHADRPGARR